LIGRNNCRQGEEIVDAGHDELQTLKLIIDEQYFEHIYDQPPVAVQAGDAVVDAGANLGVFTRFALDRGARSVIAFEPEPTNIACFKASFRPELESGRVRLVEAALWESKTFLEFSLPEPGDSPGGSLVANQGTLRIQVPTITLDEALAQLHVDRVDFIKMDVEGSERYALNGATRTVSTFSPRMAIATEHFIDDRPTILNAVNRINPKYRVITGQSVLYFY